MSDKLGGYHCGKTSLIPWTFWWGRCISTRQWPYLACRDISPSTRACCGFQQKLHGSPNLRRILSFLSKTYTRCGDAVLIPDDGYSERIIKRRLLVRYREILLLRHEGKYWLRASRGFMISGIIKPLSSLMKRTRTKQNRTSWRQVNC